MNDVLIFKLRKGHIVYYREEGEFSTNKSDERLIRGSSQADNLFFKSVFFEDSHLVLKNVMIVESKEPFIGKVDAKLFEAIVVKILKAKDIQDSYFVAFEDWPFGCEPELNLSKYVLE